MSGWAGQWVLIAHPSTFLWEIHHFPTRISVPSPSPALGGPGQTPGFASGAHRRGDPGGGTCGMQQAWLDQAHPSRLGASIRQEGGKEMEEIPKLLSREKVTTEEKMPQRSDCPLGNTRLGRRHRATAVGRCGTPGYGRASPGKP